MISIIRYTMLTALRDWLFIGLLMAVLLAVGASFFLGSTALVEQEQMTIAYAAGSARITVIAGLVLFICFHVRRSFDNKEIEVMLSRPLSRTAFVLSYWAGFAVLFIVLTLPVILIIWVFTHSDMIGLLYWGASLIFEGMLVGAFALVSSLMMRSAVTAVMACAGFYLLSRMMGFFVMTVSHPLAFAQGAEVKTAFIMQWLLKIISVALPRLDLYGKTSWLIYGPQAGHDLLWLFPVQSLVYIPLLLAMAVWDFKRKQF